MRNFAGHAQKGEHPQYATTKTPENDFSKHYQMRECAFMEP